MLQPGTWHGDIRADNMFFDGDRLKVVDFQFAALCAGAVDIACLVSQGVPTEVRRGAGSRISRTPGAHGITDYSFDEAWRHYRFAVAYLMVLRVITLNGWDAMPERSRALCLKLTERAAATIDDINALEVFA
jgi:thiamine kinase-like enzyme